MARALVVGGTGPTGPHIVDGLLERGYEVAILHGGQHEVEFSSPVEHIHTDPHFAETLTEGMARRPWWDLVVFSYGRLRVGAEVAKGRTGRVIGVGGMNPAQPRDSRWGSFGSPVNLREDDLIGEDDPAVSKISARMTEAREALFRADREGHYDATYISYPATVYGPRAQAPKEWSLIRRILDGRRRIILPDGGVTVAHRGYSANVAHGLLLAVDRADVATGRHFAVADVRQYSLRQLVEATATIMGHEWEIVDMPWELALPSRPYDHRQGWGLPSTSAIERALDFREVEPPHAALATTIEWILGHPPEPGAEVEEQLGDPFDYEKEDEFIDGWRRMTAAFTGAVERFGFREPPLTHAYRHPKAPEEAWKRPSARGSDLDR